MKKIKAKRPSRGVGLMQYAWLLGAHATAGCIYGRTTARKGREEEKKKKEMEGGKEGGREGRWEGGGIRKKKGAEEEERRERREQERRKVRSRKRKEATEGGQNRQGWDEKCKLEHATVPTQINKVIGAEKILKKQIKK